MDLNTEIKPVVTERKPYSAPIIVEYGELKDLTLGTEVANSDGIAGGSYGA
jgi:hypothetical protein